MDEFKQKTEFFIKNKIERLQKFFIGASSHESKNRAKSRQMTNLSLVIFGFVACFVVLFLFLNSNQQKNNDVENTLDSQTGIKDAQKIELGTNSTKSEIKWQSFLEDSIAEEGQKRQEQFEILKETINQTSLNTKEEVNSEFEQLKVRLESALSEIDYLKSDNRNIQANIAQFLKDDENGAALAAELGITSITNQLIVKAPVSSYNHIPATSYVSGYLLGGIAVSTSVNSAAEPIPVIIKLNGRGSLPKNFAVDIKQCRLLASCYGDISSERAIIRAEELVCEDKKSGLLTSTKVSGVIYGDDGANGIRGTVVSMSDKHLKNAFLGGVLSGFGNAAKGRESLSITSLGAVSTQKRGMKDMAQDGLLGGTSTAAEKLADYHIKLAENISPVILVPGGTKVDIMFTKSVEIGSIDVVETINANREKK